MPKQVKAGQWMTEMCDSCGYITKIKAYPGDYSGRLQRHELMGLCHLCASTKAGNAYQYPDQYRESQAVLSTICYVGNALLDMVGLDVQALQKKREKDVANGPDYVWNEEEE